MPIVLSEAEIEAYRRTGFHFPVRVMSVEEALAFRAKLERFEADGNASIRAQIKSKMHLLLTWIHELASHAAILDAVEDVLGPDILCWNSSFFIKEANDPGHVTWHQDSTYWGLSSPDVCSAWIALSPSTLESGAMRVIPGSHTLDQLAHEDTLDEHNLLTRGQRLAENPDDSSAVSLVLEPGEISLHHVSLVHGSEPNRTDDRRIGLAIRYVAPHVKQTGGIPDSAMLVRGEDRFGNFAAEIPPIADMDPAALEVHRRSLANLERLKFAGTDRRYL